tara:strand:- start:2043 stop:2462 length:420 start_codon:yes stop_codon:yes gene_type:complete
MADTVTGPTVLFESDKKVVTKIVVESDGTGSTTVFGDVSEMAARDDGTSVAHLAVMRVWFACDTGDGGDSHCRLDEEDSDGDIPVLGLVGTGYWDFRDFGGIPADKTSNSNESDVNFVVPSQADDGNMYTVVAEFQKIY